MKKYFKIALVSSFVGLLLLCVIMIIGALVQPNSFNRERIPAWALPVFLSLILVLIVSLAAMLWYERKMFTKDLKDFINS